MSTKKPSELEKARAVRYMRHIENCNKCTSSLECTVGLGHCGRWVKSYYREALGACKHLAVGECWTMEGCRGGKAHWGLPRS